VAGSSRREAVLLGPSGRARRVGVPSRTELPELPAPPLSDLGRAGGELHSLCDGGTSDSAPAAFLRLSFSSIVPTQGCTWLGLGLGFS